MKKTLCILAGLLLMVGNSAFAADKAKKCDAKKCDRVVLAFSQGFQGPEKWEKHCFPIDKNGYITIFDGTSLNGFRGYGKNHVPSRWILEDGCLKFLGKKNPASEGKEGGDIIFAHKFKNFEMELEWKISQGGNSGIFYLATENAKADGSKLEPIYVSCPECQVLDNENHPDAKLGKDGNRQASSLYDMIPAKPQNAKPYGQWNKIKIRVDNGKITHYQNGVQVLQYEMWTPEWIALLQSGKFSEAKWPAAFRLLSNCGGDEHAGFIGFQDHGDDVWYRNIRVKVLD
ncbi:MAG: DUF1080 domain-containing protein [Bacteroidaceae bacterium]|nr:DUF1080 domain-containing protein [Bacteroidaceae bacterium]